MKTQILKSTWENIQNASRIVCLKGSGQEHLFTSSPPLLVDSFSRLANIIEPSSCSCPKQTHLSALGHWGKSWGQKRKILDECALLSESKSERNCLSQPLGSEAWARDYKAGCGTGDINLEVINVYIMSFWVGNWLNRRKFSLSQFKSNHLCSHPLYLLVSLILT